MKETFNYEIEYFQNGDIVHNVSIGKIGRYCHMYNIGAVGITALGFPYSEGGNYWYDAENCFEPVPLTATTMRLFEGTIIPYDAADRAYRKVSGSYKWTPLAKEGEALCTEAMYDDSMVAAYVQLCPIYTENDKDDLFLKLDIGASPIEKAGWDETKFQNIKTFVKRAYVCSGLLSRYNKEPYIKSETQIRAPQFAHQLQRLCTAFGRKPALSSDFLVLDEGIENS